MNNKEAYPPSFSEIYDLALGAFASSIAPQIYNIYIVESIHNDSRSLLDICCGSGQLACYFLQKGFTITGIDLSDRILEIAQRKTEDNPNAEWIQADAVEFSLDRKFGIAVSTFDSLNLLPDIESLNKCFRCVYDHLVEDGIFIFDINTKIGISTSNNIYITETNDFTMIVRGYFDSRINRGFIRFSGFLKSENELFKRFEHCSSSTVFFIDEIEKLLLHVGFRDIRYYIFGNTEMELIKDPEAYMKVAIYAKK